MANTLKLGNGKWATGKDTLMSFSDTNNNFKPLPFDFSRASSATVVNQSGLIETVGSGEPRIDFKDNTKGALLLEPQRTNSFPYSEDFTQWTNSGLTLNSNQTISPDGTNNASEIIGTGYLQEVISLTTSNDYVFSLFWKKNTSNKIKFLVSSTGNDEALEIDTNTLSVLSQVGIDNYSIDNYGNGWYRMSMIWNENNTEVSGIRVFADTTDALSSLYIYGAQLEVGSYATSYIPTSGQSGGVTRVADACSQTPPDGVIGQTEGVIYWEGIINGIDVNFSNIVTGEKNTTTSFAVLHKGSSSQFQCSVFDGSEKGRCIGGSVSVGETCKIAYAYKSGNFALYVNGVSVATSTDTWTPPSTIDDIYIGDTTSYFGNKESNTHKEVKLYNTRLSNAELQALTTI